jgi:hypothetical protein
MSYDAACVDTEEVDEVSAPIDLAAVGTQPHGLAEHLTHQRRLEQTPHTQTRREVEGVRRVKQGHQALA